MTVIVEVDGTISNNNCRKYSYNKWTVLVINYGDLLFIQENNKAVGYKSI